MTNWILATECTPLIGDMVLVWDGYDVMPGFYCNGHFELDNMDYDGGSARCDTVTHWMPFPPGPISEPLND